MDNTVDMLAAARDAQFSATTYLGEGAIKLFAPAKVNLYLEVGPRRADGYHEVYNIMHTLLLHDTIYMNATQLYGEGEAPKVAPDGYELCGPANNIAVRLDTSDKTCEPGDAPEQIPTQKNLIFKAIDTLAHKANIVDAWRFSIYAEKQIPAQAGLGGGSSDAAAALLGAAHFWGIKDRTNDAIHASARELGADVAFFLHGGCAAFSGAGEVFERALAPRTDAICIVKPAGGVSTAAAYAAFDRAPAPVADDARVVAHTAADSADVQLTNNLTAAACKLNPDVAAALEFLHTQPELANQSPLVAGSGAAVWAYAPNFAAANAIVARARARGFFARATTFGKIGARNLG